MKRLDISTGELLEAMIAGKLEDWNNLDFKMYLEENGLDNRESLRLLLEEIEKKIEETRDGVFIPEHERESLAILRKRLEGKPVAPEYVKHVEELEEEERIMEQSGKKSLYRAMEERGFFNDAHEIAVSTALQDGNMKLLKRYWEEAVLGKVLEFRDHVKGMLVDEEERGKCVKIVENQCLKQGKKVKGKDGPGGSIISLFCHYTVKNPSSLSKEEVEDILSMFGNPITPKSLGYAIDQKLLRDPIYEPTDTRRLNNNRRKWLNATLQYLKEFGYDTKKIEADIAKFKNFK